MGHFCHSGRTLAGKLLLLPSVDATADMCSTPNNVSAEVTDSAVAARSLLAATSEGVAEPISTIRGCVA